MSRRTIVIGLVGMAKDAARPRQERWERWRPTVSLAQHEDLLVDRLELLFEPRVRKTAEVVVEDVVVLEFGSLAGTTYLLESTADLVVSDFESAGITLLGDGGVMDVVVPAGISTSRTYRIVVASP